MKKMILLYATALIALNSNAQWGLKAGLNFSDLSGNGTGFSKTTVGFHGGGFYNARINRMFVFQPDLLYSSQGAKNENTDETLRLNYFNLTPLFLYYPLSGFFVGTGPQFGFLIAAHDKAGNASADVREFFKSTDFSWAFALGYRLPKGYGFYGRYNLGLSNINDQGGNGTIKNNVIQLGFLYEFTKLKK